MPSLPVNELITIGINFGSPILKPFYNYWHSLIGAVTNFQNALE